MSLFDSSKALRDMQELAYEVENNLFIPKRFRKKPFTEVERKRYTDYLKREISFLEQKLKRMH